MKKIPAPPGMTRLAVSLLLSAAVALAAAPAAAQIDPLATLRYIVLQQDEKIPLAAGPGEPLVRPVEPPALIEPPAHGTFYTDSQESFYTADPGFIGRDRLAVAEASGTLHFDLTILPRLLPFAGRFKAGSSLEAAGLFDNETRSFLLCLPLVSRHQPLDCRRFPVSGLSPAPRIPVAWPDTRGGGDQPALLDLETGDLVAYRESAGALVVAAHHQLPAGGWPLAGDWLGNGVRSLAMVFADGTVKTLEGARWQPWGSPLHVPAGDALVWPIVLQREEGPDAVALVDPGNGDLHWLKLDGSGSTIGDVEPCLGSEQNLRQPLAWNMSPMPDSVAASTEVFFLSDSPQGLALIPGIYRGGKPQTIPVKFPDDPPGP